MRFGELFSKSWKEYKRNFWTIFKIFLFLYFLPLICLFLSSMFLPEFEGPLLSYLANTSVLIFLFLVIVYIFLSFISGISYIYVSIFQEVHHKIGFKKSVKGGLSYFWKYLGLVLLLTILFIILLVLPLLAYTLILFFPSSSGLFISIFLSLILLIPLLVFFIYWIFSPYILIRERTGIWESIKRSKIIIKGHWWRVFGNLILLSLIIILISIPFAIPNFVFSLFANELGVLLLGKIISYFSSLITYPLEIFFVKNLYIELRTNLHKSKK